MELNWGEVPDEMIDEMAKDDEELSGDPYSEIDWHEYH